MINLKKNDKIIIIAAIAVIIVAAIGIAIYNPTEEKTGSNTNKNMMQYSVNWDIESSSIPMISDYAGKNSPYEGTIRIDHGNLKRIMFNISWTDDKATIFNRFGLDTITLEVTTPDGDTYEGSMKSASKTKMGNFEFDIQVDGIPSTEPIMGEDINDAQDQLNYDPYYKDKWENKDFTIKVYDQIGEKRILKKLGDKGNSFDLDIMYEYYQPTLVEEQTKETGNPDDNNIDNEFIGSYYLSMIISTGRGFI